MMVIREPQRHRTKTRELGPFWQSLHACRHDSTDLDVQAVEWAGLPDEMRRSLLRAGFTCGRQVEACPDWLLLSVPNVGILTLQTLRALYPYRRDVHRRPVCVGRQLENDRYIARNTRPMLVPVDAGLSG